MLLETVRLDCPYCGQTFTTTADLSGGSQQYIEDCPVPVDGMITPPDTPGLGVKPVMANYSSGEATIVPIAYV
mgnify:CR=1 FL=1